MPAPYKLLVKRSAERELRALPKPDRKRIVGRIQSLAFEPRPTGCEKLFGEHGYRVRQGDYRILYTVDDGAPEVQIYQIGHRRAVYR